MSEPITSPPIRVTYEAASVADLLAWHIATVEAEGYTVTRTQYVPRETLRELSARLGMCVQAVGARLRDPNCPPCDHERTKDTKQRRGRILWVRANPDLEDFLTIGCRQNQKQEKP